MSNQPAIQKPATRNPATLKPAEPAVAVAVAEPTFLSTLSPSKVLAILLAAAVAGVLFYLAITTSTTVDLMALAEETMSEGAIEMVVDATGAIYRQPSP